MKGSRLLAALACLSACATACGRNDGETDADATRVASASTPAVPAAAAATDTTPPRDLASTHWRLAEIQSMSDQQQPTRVDDPAAYTISFDSEGGFLTMRLDCKSASASYEDSPTTDKLGGSITIGPLKTTPAQCPPTSLADRIARDMRNVRTYRFVNGRLALSLMADGGIYLWERDRTPR
jgi:hypothetical protein